jgi:sulfur carrier protein
MMVVLNGQELQMAVSSTVEQVVRGATQREDLRGIAVARNRRVVPRSLWAATELEEGDVLDLVGVMQGG